MRSRVCASLAHALRLRMLWHAARAREQRSALLASCTYIRTAMPIRCRGWIPRCWQPLDMTTLAAVGFVSTLSRQDPVLDRKGAEVASKFRQDILQPLDPATPAPSLMCVPLAKTTSSFMISGSSAVKISRLRRIATAAGQRSWRAP